MEQEQLYTLEEAQKELARASNRKVWELLDQPERSCAEDQEMLLAAQASLYLWSQAGTAVHRQRGHWLISRVCVELGKTEGALEQAIRCQEITKDHPEEMKDFDLAYAQEALARAYALAGNSPQADKHRGMAAALGEKITDPEDREIFLSDLQGGNWSQLPGFD